MSRKKSSDVRQTPIEPITCPHCGGRAYLVGGPFTQRSRVRYGRLSARIAVSRPKKVCCIKDSWKEPAFRPFERILFSIDPHGRGRRVASNSATARAAFMRRSFCIRRNGDSFLVGGRIPFDDSGFSTIALLNHICGQAILVGPISLVGIAYLQDRLRRPSRPGPIQTRSKSSISRPLQRVPLDSLL